jgi:hypothetical protein
MSVRSSHFDEIPYILDMGFQVHIAGQKVGTLPHARQSGGEDLVACSL